MYDTYGDGWNGGNVSVYVGGSLVLANVTLGSGYGPANYTFTASTGQSIQVYYSAGSWAYENYYNLTDGNGSVSVSNWYPSSSGTWSGTGSCPAPCTSPAIPGFGSNTWNVLCYGDNNFTAFKGYYTENNLNFNSASRWGTGDTPSNANAASGSAYIGCPIGIDNHSVIYKRQGFPTGTYSININRDDDYILFVNGTQVNSGGCCGWTNNTWTGALNASSTVEIRMREYGGGSQIQADFAAPSYCSPYTNYTCCMGISQVVFNTINNTSGTTNNIYQNFTSLTTNVEVGSTTNLFIAGWSYEQYATVWVDLNNNFTFEASERLATGVYMGYNCNIAITIPTGTSLGNHRMRIRTQYYWDGVQYDPCATTNYGETEDYTINVTAPCVPPSVPGFGNNTWNVLGYSHGGYNYGNITAMAGHTFKGFYTNSTVDITSQNQWCNDCSPSNASGWTGCSLGVDNHTVVYKRQGFPTAFYQIDLNSHDDGVQCYVNGSLVYQTDGCCTDRGVIWSGVLCASSTVEFRVMEGGGGSHLLVDFIDSPFTAGTISGTPTVCPGSTSNFTSNGNSGGTWSSSNTNVASVNSSTGLVTAVNTGSATITYTISNAQCGNVSTTYAVSVPAAASSGTISGNTSVCLGNTSQLSSNGTSGGTWSSSNTGVATVNGSGLVTSVAAGSSTITYTVAGTNGCPNASSTANLTINAAPTAVNAGFDASICSGGSVQLNGSANGPLGGSIVLNFQPQAYGDQANWRIERISDGAVLNSGGPYYSTATQTINLPSYTEQVRLVINNGSYCDNNPNWSVTCNGSPIGNGTVSGCFNGVVLNNIGCSLPVSYSWSPTVSLNNSNISNPLASPASQTTYTLTATYNGCSATDQVVVSMRTLPVPPAYSANPTTLCIGNTTDLTVNGLAPSGQAFEGNGSNSYIKVYQDIPEYNFTIEMWMKTSAANTGIFGVYEDGGGHDRHLYLNGGQLWARVWQGNGWNTGVTLNDGQWHHIALTVQTGVGQKVYVDGNQVATYGYDHSDFNWQSSFHIGYSNDMGHFNGLIDNVRIWNVVRSQSDLANNMYLNAPAGGGLVANYLMEGNANATAAGNNGNAYNNTWANSNYITYTWTGAGAPAASFNTSQTSSPLSASTNYTVSASAGGCLGTASPNIAVTVNGISTTSAPANTDMVWRGAASTDYATVDNWLQFNGTTMVPATVAPTASTNVIIPANQTCVPNQPNTNANIGNANSLRIENGATLTMGSGNLNVAGNWVNNGSFVPGTGTVTFAGSGTHSISGSSANHNFNNLTMNKTGEIILSVPAILSGSLTLTNGRLNIGNFNLDLPTNTINGGNANSYVKTSGTGELRRNLPVGSTVLFPVGRSTYNPVELVKSGSLHKFGVRVLDVVTANGQDGGNASTGPNVGRMWNITPAAGYSAANGAVEVSLIYANNMGYFTNGYSNAIADRRMFHFGPAWSDISDVTGTFVTGDYSLANYNFCRQPGVTNFSPFTVSNFGAALPVELISFTANCTANPDQVNVSWSTATEHNSSHFVVERSTDGNAWEYLNITAAAGNSTIVQNYSFTDNDARGYENIYYRLVQFDNDGVFEQFGPVSVACNNSNSSTAVSTYPNPSDNSFYISLYTEEMEGAGVITITDTKGALVHTQDVDIQKGNTVFHIDNLNVAPGIYYIQVSNGYGTSDVVKHSLR